MKILILEDNQERQKKFLENLAGHTVTIVDTSAAAIRLLARKKWGWLFLDHDLGGKIMQESGPNTGYEVACWLEEHVRRRPGVIIIHSFNPDGSRKMSQALPEAYLFPAAWDYENLVGRWQDIKLLLRTGNK